MLNANILDSPKRPPEKEVRKSDGVYSLFRKHIVHAKTVMVKGSSASGELMGYGSRG